MDQHWGERQVQARLQSSGIPAILPAQSFLPYLVVLLLVLRNLDLQDVVM